MEFEGFVLVGGRSSRFGADKALAPWNGRPLLEVPVRLLRALGTVPRLVGRDPAPYAGFGCPFVLAERPGLGPAEGLRAALRACAAPRALVLSVDMPGVTEEVARTLLAFPPEPAVCLEHGTLRHPFPGVYPRSGLAVLDALPPGSSMQTVLEGLRAVTLGADRLPGDPDPDSILRNVNRPHDMPGENPIDTPRSRS